MRAFICNDDAVLQKGKFCIGTGSKFDGGLLSYQNREAVIFMARLVAADTPCTRWCADT
jgi:hypothetical protein